MGGADGSNDISYDITPPHPPPSTSASPQALGATSTAIGASAAGEATTSESDSAAQQEQATPRCEGKPYAVPYQVTCPYHAAAVERVLRDLMGKAKQLIDTDLGKIVSNLPEKFAWVCKGFRNKEHVLQALHYKLKTNMGLLQGNQTAMCRMFDHTYHWKLDVLKAAGLPISETLPETCAKENKERAAAVAASQELKTKRKRIERKEDRSKKWAKRSLHMAVVRKRQEGRSVAHILDEYTGGGNLLAGEKAAMDVDMDDAQAAPGRSGDEVLASMKDARDQQRQQALQLLQARVQAKGHTLVSKLPENRKQTAALTDDKPKRARKEARENGRAGACTCRTKCAQKGCPCKAANVHCTAQCTHCALPGSKCCNTPGGKAASSELIDLGLLVHETPTPASCTFDGNLTKLPLPKPCILITGDLETTGKHGVYLNDITQMCFMSQLISADSQVTALQPSLTTYVSTEQEIPAWCEELTGISSMCNADSKLRGAPQFEGAWTRLTELLPAIQACAGVPPSCPIVIAGHNFVQFDFIALYCQSSRAGKDVLARLRECGVVGLVDTLHAARAATWPTAPTDPDTGKPSFKLAACYAAAGNGLMLNAHDARADVEANQAVLTFGPVLAQLEMYSLEQCVLRARVFRRRHTLLKGGALHQAEVRLMVQRFAEKAPAASRLQLPAAAKALRAAAHDEAKKQGITSVGAGDEESTTRCVVLVHAPPTPRL